MQKMASAGAEKSASMSAEDLIQQLEVDREGDFEMTKIVTICDDLSSK